MLGIRGNGPLIDSTGSGARTAAAPGITGIERVACDGATGIDCVVDDGTAGIERVACGAAGIGRTGGATGIDRVPGDEPGLASGASGLGTACVACLIDGSGGF